MQADRSSDAFDRLSAEAIDRLRTGVRLLALRRLGDLDIAEEVAQETLVRAVAAVRDGRLRDAAKLGSFVRGIARHVIGDRYRRRDRVEPIGSGRRPVARSRAPDPLTALITKQERRRVRRALGRLSGRDQEILRLSFFHGLEPAEIAARSGEPAPRIRKRKSRALARLRAALLDRDGRGHEHASHATEFEDRGPFVDEQDREVR